MHDLETQLRAALADRFRVEHEIGRGGMAHVFLAHDLKLDRPVALKVLKPELTAVLGSERFLREIAFAAKLEHPHILGIHDSGEAGGILYYVMPYVEGESLRGRLDREKQLPLDDALQIAREVADALSYAHARGIIHRDIKPENILLAGGHAVVADFGIARAVTEAGGERLTSSGISLGTPTYMSPEQAAGRAEVDARSDLYSLGCVLYELLSGHPPFQGTTVQELMARHATDPVPPLRSARNTIPLPVEEAVLRVLEKAPADRFPTALGFGSALQLDAGAYRRRRRMWRRARQVVVALVAVAVVAGAVYGFARYRGTSSWKWVDLDPNAVAILPFEVRASEPSLAMLDEGMIDFLYPILAGDAGTRAVEPTPVLLTLADLRARGEWSTADAPLRLAARFRASLVLEGRIAEAGGRLTMNAWLRRVPDGETVARSTVSGPPDSLHALVQRLAIELLGDRLGESRDRLASLAGRPPEAVNAYLAGTRALRAGRYADAIRALGHALELDTTFALAGLRYAQIGVPAIEPLRIARTYRASLGRREQAALAYFLMNQRVDTLATDADMLGAIRAWLDVAPDDANAWGAYGVRLRSAGSTIPIAAWEDEARRALERAWALDSTTPDNLTRHVGLALNWEDLTWLRRVGPQYLALADTLGREWMGMRWVIAIALGDSATVRELRARAAAGDPEVATARVRARVQQMEILLGRPTTDSDMLREYVRSHVVTRLDSTRHATDLVYEGLWKGRLRQVMDVLTGPLGLVSWNFRAGRQMFLLDFALMYPGLDSAAAAAAESVRTIAAEPAPPYEGGIPYDQPPHLQCYHLVYRAAHGDTLDVRAEAGALEPWFREFHMEGVCPALAEALVESHIPALRETPALDRLEAMLRRGTEWEFPTNAAIPLLVRLRRQRGQFDRALAAARMHLLGNPFFWQHRVALLREEGHLAAVVGDTAAAIAAYERYLALRTDPDDLARPQADSVRAALAVLRS